MASTVGATWADCSNDRFYKQGATGLPEQVFADQLVSATDLNKKSGTILDLAARQPVTITRNNEAFALLRREVARRMATAWSEAVLLGQALLAIRQLKEGSLAPDHRFSWLRAFDFAELEDLVCELASALAISEDLDADEVQMSVSSILHEWRESAAAIMSSTHAEAYGARGKEPQVPLTPPSEVEPNV